MIERTLDNQTAIIALDRADKHNALTPEMLDQLQASIAGLDDDLGALVIHGRGKSFCAGFDLKRCAADPQGGTMRSLLTGLSRTVALLRSRPFPVVLAAHGAAVAGGCALLGGADIVVADRATKLGYPVVKIGVSPAISSPFMLASIAPGPVRARLLDTELIDAPRAHELGLVHELCDTPEQTFARATELARTLADKPRSGVHATKRLLNRIAEPMSDHAQRALDASLALTGGPEERQRLAALWSH